MAIGTAAAIGLGVAGIGSVIGAKSASSAASKASDTSLAVAQQNNDLARDIYGQNKDALNPFVQRGNKAGDAINALLGLGGPEFAQEQPQQQSVFSQYGGNRNYGYDPREPFTDSGFYQNSIMGAPFGGFNPVGGGRFGYQNGPQGTYAGGGTLAGAANGAPISVNDAQAQQENAFDVFRGSTGYQFRVNEGANALNSNFAGGGVLRSGAAAKAMQDYAQNTASSEFGNYMGYLSNQQGVGLGGASALAGVGQNYVNNVSANNNSAGTAAANAALVKGQNNPFAALAGTIGGFASSYGG